MTTNRTSTFNTENVTSSVSKDRISTFYAEVITPAPIVLGTNRVSNFYFEAVTSMPPSNATNRVSDLYLELITGLAPPRLDVQARAMIMA